MLARGWRWGPSTGGAVGTPVGFDVWRRGRVVQARACKALYPGSIPGVASLVEVAGPDGSATRR